MSGLMGQEWCETCQQRGEIRLFVLNMEGTSLKGDLGACSLVQTFELCLAGAAIVQNDFRRVNMH